MSKNSGAWSRLATPVIVDDLHRDEALAFLKSPYLIEHEQMATGSAGDGKVQKSASLRSGKPMDDDLAGRIVEMVGGRILQLIAMKRDWLYGVSFDNSAEELKNSEREKLLQVHLYMFLLITYNIIQQLYPYCCKSQYTGKYAIFVN